MKRKLSLAGFVQQRKPHVKTLSAAKKKRGKSPLEHVPEKLIDFSDGNMLQHIDCERFLLDRMTPSDQKKL